MIYVGKVLKEGEQINVLCCCYDKLVVIWPFSMEIYFLTIDYVKIGNLKRKNRDHKKVPKQDEDAGNL